MVLTRVLNLILKMNLILIQKMKLTTKLDNLLITLREYFHTNRDFHFFYIFIDSDSVDIVKQVSLKFYIFHIYSASIINIMLSPFLHCVIVVPHCTKTELSC